MPPPAQLILAIEQHSELAEASLIPQMLDQGKRARRTFLNAGPDLGAEMLSQMLIPNAFAGELFDAAEDAVADMSEFAFGYALDTLPAAFEGVVVTEVSRQTAIQGVLANVSDHIVDVNDYTRTRVRDLITRASIDGLDNAEIAGGIERLVGDLETKDGRLVPRRVRSRTIARTETAFASASSETAAWKEVGVRQVMVFDGIGCGWSSHDDPDSANDTIRELGEYEGQPLSHPNCVRTAAPVDPTASP